MVMAVDVKQDKQNKQDKQDKQARQIECEWCKTTLGTASFNRKYCSAGCKTNHYYKRKADERAVALLREWKDVVVEQLVQEEIEKARVPLNHTIAQLLNEIERMRGLMRMALADGR